MDYHFLNLDAIVGVLSLVVKRDFFRNGLVKYNLPSTRVSTVEVLPAFFIFIIVSR